MGRKKITEKPLSIKAFLSQEQESWLKEQANISAALRVMINNAMRENMNMRLIEVVATALEKQATEGIVFPRSVSCNIEGSTKVDWRDYLELIDFSSYQQKLIARKGSTAKIIKLGTIQTEAAFVTFYLIDCIEPFAVKECFKLGSVDISVVEISNVPNYLMASLGQRK